MTTPLQIRDGRDKCRFCIYSCLLYGTVRYCTVLYGTVRYTVRYCTVLYGTVRYCTVKILIVSSSLPRAESRPMEGMMSGPGMATASLLLLYQLEDKHKVHNLLLGFLKSIGLWGRMSTVTSKGRVLSTRFGLLSEWKIQDSSYLTSTEVDVEIGVTSKARVLSTRFGLLSEWKIQDSSYLTSTDVDVEIEVTSKGRVLSTRFGLF